MRVVVTGATSMIGVALIQECLANDCEVLAIVRKGTGRINRLPESDNIRIEYADLDSLDHVQGDGKSYDVFYHFAWGHTIKSERDEPLDQEDNIRSTLRAVELANKLGCSKFIGAGSQAEYGPVDGVISSDTRTEPVTAYGMAKLSASMLSRKMCEKLGIRYIWGRIFSVYGCNDNDGTMLNYAIDQFMKGETARFSSATQMWNYLYEEDAGKIFYLLGAKEVDSGVYCVANQESRVFREYIEELQEMFGENAKCEFAPVNSNVKAFGLQADITKTVDATGFIPRTDFKEGIMKVVECKKNRGYNL